MNTLAVRVETMGQVERIAQDIAAMMPLEKEISSFEQASYHIDKYGTALVRGVHYSVPDDLVGMQLTAFIYCNRIGFFHKGKQVASHERTPLNGWKLNLMHYLHTLRKKPGALASSQALRMAENEIQELFDKHFTDNPQDFITLLTLAKEKEITLEDVTVTYKLLRESHVTPSLDAFKQLLFGEKAPESSIMTGTEASSQIEDYSMSALRELSNLMSYNQTSCNHGTAYS